MKKRTKIILGSILAVVFFGGFVIAAVIGLLGYGFYKIGGLETVGKLQQANAEGSEYGKTTDHNGCMEKGYTLSVSATGVDLTAEEFVRGCLNTSRASTDFCDGVTSVLDREYFKVQCKKVGHETDACEESFLAKRNFCRMHEKN
jgi:hypothetical protein